MTRVTGRTYENRGAIKALGFRWEARTKSWVKGQVSEEELAALKEIRGLVIETEAGEINTMTYKQKYGRCEDAPCCGCCGYHPYYGGE